MIQAIEDSETDVTITYTRRGRDRYSYDDNTLFFSNYRGNLSVYPTYYDQQNWFTVPAMVVLAHELQHCYDDIVGGVTSLGLPHNEFKRRTETGAMVKENIFREAIYNKTGQAIWPRPGYGPGHEDMAGNIDTAWRRWWKNPIGKYP